MFSVHYHVTGDDEIRFLGDFVVVSCLVHPSGNTTINTSTGLERGGVLSGVCVLEPLDLRFSRKPLRLSIWTNVFQYGSSTGSIFIIIKGHILC